MSEHYLKKELYELIASDPSIFEFLQAGSLDGVWYWDLEKPENEWMSPQFWETLGWDPADREHLSSEWQDLIHPNDLKIALDEYQACLDEPGRLYNCPSVRYKGPDGEWRWVHCRGYMVRDESGKPIRMLGAHNELTDLKLAEEALRLQTELAEAFADLKEIREKNRKKLEMVQSIMGEGHGE